MNGAPQAQTAGCSEFWRGRLVLALGAGVVVLACLAVIGGRQSESADLRAVRRVLPHFAPRLSRVDSWLFNRSSATPPVVRGNRLLLPDWMTRRAVSNDWQVTLEEMRPRTVMPTTNLWPVVPNLVRLLSGRYQSYAFQVLAHHGADHFPGMPELLRAERGAGPTQMWRWILGGTEPQTPDAALYRRFSFYTLSHIGSPPAVALCVELVSENKHRREAIQCLDTIGPRAQAAGPALKQIVFDDQTSDPPDRVACLAALVHIGGSNAIPTLRECLALPSSELRVCAAENLWELKQPATEYVPMLRDALTSKRPSIRLRALELLKKMGESARPLATEITARTSDDDERIRSLAALVSASLR